MAARSNGGAFGGPAAAAAGASFASCASAGGASSLKEQEEEVAQLHKQLFNMKLRVFYLEERLSKNGGSGGSAEVDELLQENLQQKMLIEEKAQELEQRNILLVKARNAIQSLQVCAPSTGN